MRDTPWVGKYVHSRGWWEPAPVSRPAASSAVMQQDREARPLLYDAAGRPLQRERRVGFTPRQGHGS
jgi:hypothetical protein